MTLFQATCSTLNCRFFSTKPERPQQISQSSVQTICMEMQGHSTAETRKQPRLNHERSTADALRRQINSMRAESLCKAAENGDIETVQILLARGVIDPSWSRDPEIAGDMDGAPLRLALEHGHSEIVLALLDDQRLQFSATQKDFDLVYQNLLRLQRLSGSTADARLQRFLLHPKINPDWKNEFGQTMLVKAISEEEIDLARTLLTRADIQIASNEGCTALHEASKQDYLLVKELLNKGADPSAKTANLATPLHWAMRGDFRSIGPLIEFNAETNSLDRHDATPLHHATFYLGDDVIESQITVLLNAGANPTLCDKYGDSPLHRIIRRGHLGAFEKMLASIVEPNELSEIGSGLINTARDLRRGDMYEALLKKGCKPSTDPDFEKKLHIAKTISDRYRAKRTGDWLRTFIKFTPLGAKINYLTLDANSALLEDIGVPEIDTSIFSKKIHCLSFPEDEYEWRIIGADELFNPMDMSEEERSTVFASFPAGFINASFFNIYQTHIEYPEHAPIGKTIIDGKNKEFIEIPEDYTSDFTPLIDSRGSQIAVAPILYALDSRAPFNKSKLKEKKYQYETSVERANADGEPLTPGELFHASHPNPRSAISFPGAAQQGVTEGYQDNRIRLIVGTNQSFNRGSAAPGWNMADWKEIVSRFTSINGRKNGFAVNLDGGGSVKLGFIDTSGKMIVEVQEDSLFYLPNYIILTKK